MTAYVGALSVGLVLAVASRVAMWRDLRRAQRTRTEPHTGLVALALFIFTVSSALVLVGVVGVRSQVDRGHGSPVFLDLVVIVATVCVVVLFVSRLLRRRRHRRAHDETQVRDRKDGLPPPQDR